MAGAERNLSIAEVLNREASNAGFLASGVVDIDSAFQTGAIQPHISRYDRWLKNGFAGDMGYLTRGRDHRADPKLLFPEAKSIFLVLSEYNATPAGSLDAAQGPRYARYLRGEDYHLTLKDRLEALMKRVCLFTSEDSTTPWADLKYKICVDTSAILERSWASLAGLGWIGKNTLLIHPKFGSYTFIGAVLLDQLSGESPKTIADLCGHCEQCLKACPTQALREPHELDSNRCISYLTLEKRGEWDISENVRSEIGPWVAGCDLCQEVCPFNFKPAKYATQPVSESPVFLNDWEKLLSESEENYRLRIKNTSLSRVKPKDFKRNLEAAHNNCVNQKT